MGRGEVAGCGCARGRGDGLFIISTEGVCGMRISPEGARKFISLYIFLMYYAGQERHLLPPDMTLDEFKESELEVKIACRDAIYEPRHLIMRFLDANRELLTHEAQDTLASWAEHYVKGKFYLLRHLKR